MARQKKADDPMQGFRAGGSFDYNGKQVVLLMNSKTGQLAFEIDHQLVSDPAVQNELMAAFQVRNQLPPEKK
ncbi:hypothetical protein AAK899_08060 [Erysipelotrichaceae bacterium 51-3]